jgi:hypothetical protein
LLQAKNLSRRQSAAHIGAQSAVSTRPTRTLSAQEQNMEIDPSRVTPVPKEDTDKLKAAVRERVIKPIQERHRAALAHRQQRGLTLGQWTAMREYIAAEVRLGVLRFQRESGQCEAVRIEEIKRLEEQSTRMETILRESL